jgi:urea transport system ATP-binding protein
VFKSLTLFENLSLALRHRRHVFATLFSVLQPVQKGKIYATLETLGLQDKAQQTAATLSHGEMQWLEIGMVIVQEPVLFLLDEPVAGMTKEEREKTGELLQWLAKDHAVLVVEHDMEFVRQTAQRVTVLHEGNVLCEGSVQHVQSDARVVEVYLGRG